MNLTPIDPLGAGAFADVWLAEDTDLGRKVAVKFFRDPYGAVHQKLALDHAKALARVQHPAVVTVFGIEPQRHPETQQECLAIVMEYVEGEPLSRCTQRFTLEQARIVLDDIAFGLEAIHTADMVHGDLHEGNILITSRGAKILDILYTRSLADASSRAAQSDRQVDIRDYSKLLRRILERVNGMDVGRLANAQYLAESAPSARQALEVFWSALGTSDQNARFTAGRSAETIFENRDIYLVLIKQDGLSYPRTRGYVAETQGLKLLGEAPRFFHATRDRLWELRAAKRMFRILSEEALNRWQQGESPKAEDYKPTAIFDPSLFSSTDDVQLILGDGAPEAFSTQDYFAYDRSIVILGALGPFVFTEQHDYTFGGGAHGGVGSRFRLINLDEMRISETPEELFGTEEAAALERHREVARQTFSLLRKDELMLPDELEIQLASVRPFVDPGLASHVEIMLTFFALASYVSSDGRWASYTVSEELKFRSELAAVASFSRIPDGLAGVLGDELRAVVGWSRVSVSHPAYRELLERLTGVRARAGSVGGTILPQHNLAAPWRTPYHGLTDEDIATAVASELCQRSRSREEALDRLHEQLRVELSAAGRNSGGEGFARRLAEAARHIEEFFGRLPTKEP